MALTIEQAMTMTLANSPEIRVISFDPEIARQEVIGAAGAFDPAVFGRVNYDDQDSPQNSIFEPGQAETRLFESGVRQTTPLGTEWSASYALARIWDDLFGRTLPTRYEPAVIFELRQPLLRDAWEQVEPGGREYRQAQLRGVAAWLSRAGGGGLQRRGGHLLAAGPGPQGPPNPARARRSDASRRSARSKAAGISMPRTCRSSRPRRTP